MIPQRYRSNLPPTGNGRARLLKLYATKEKEIEGLSISILSDTASITASKTAIASIKKTIQHSRVALNTYNLNLAAIKGIRHRLGSLPVELDLGPAAEDESQSLEVCQRVTTFISLSTSSEVQPLKDQQDTLETRIANLASMLSSLEKELLDWQVDLALNEASLKELQVCSSNLKPILLEIKNLLSPIKHVPNEVWLQIFRLVHDENLSQRLPLLRPSHALLLSHVCRKWREVAIMAPKLWNCIDIAPLPWWTTQEQVVIGGSVERSRGQTVELFLRLWVTRDWDTQALASASRGRLYLHEVERAAYPYNYPPFESDYTGTSRQDLSMNDINFVPQSYSLHLQTRSDVYTAEKSPPFSPFRDPQSLTIQAVSPRVSTRLREMTSSFSGIKKLVLVDIWPSSGDTIPPNLPNLIYLGLDLHAFKSFDISPLLLPTLEELHIRHDGTETFQEVISPVALSKLHTLSFTLNDYPLCSKLMTPMLRSLTLRPSLPVVDTEKALQHFEIGHQYERLTDLNFNGWSHLNMEPSSLDILKRLLSKSTQLYRLSFISCHIDGEMLLALLQGEIQAEKEPSDGKAINKKIEILSCTGITRKDCEQIHARVQKMTVRV